MVSSFISQLKTYKNKREYPQTKELSSTISIFVLNGYPTPKLQISSLLSLHNKGVDLLCVGKAKKILFVAQVL